MGETINPNFLIRTKPATDKTYSREVCVGYGLKSEVLTGHPVPVWSWEWMIVEDFFGDDIDYCAGAVVADSERDGEPTWRRTIVEVTDLLRVLVESGALPGGRLSPELAAVRLDEIISSEIASSENSVRGTVDKLMLRYLAALVMRWSKVVSAPAKDVSDLEREEAALAAARIRSVLVMFATLTDLETYLEVDLEITLEEGN